MSVPLALKSPGFNPTRSLLAREKAVWQLLMVSMSSLPEPVDNYTLNRKDFFVYALYFTFQLV